MQTPAAVCVFNVRSAVLVSLGIEFTRSHGLEYAKSLLEVLGADDETIQLFVTRVVAERCQQGIVGGKVPIKHLS